MNRTKTKPKYNKKRATKHIGNILLIVWDISFLFCRHFCAYLLHSLFNILNRKYPVYKLNQNEA